MSWDPAAVEPYAKDVFDAVMRGEFDEIEKIRQNFKERFFTPGHRAANYFYLKVLRDWNRCVRDTSKGSTRAFEAPSTLRECLREVCKNLRPPSEGEDLACDYLEKYITKFETETLSWGKSSPKVSE